MSRPRQGKWAYSFNRRIHQWVRLSDEEYEARYERLKAIYHPAVAAIMAHEEPCGPGALERMIHDD